jgi:hypothetical protein
MNCREFNLHVVDWVRGAALDPRTRLEAETHAAACGHCRDRLAAERALTAGLDQLANSAAAHETPAGVEDLLRTAFREQIATSQPQHLKDGAHLKGGEHRAGHLKDGWRLAAWPQLGRVAWTGAAAAAVIAGVLLWMSRERAAAPPEMGPVIAETAPASEQPLNKQPGTEQTGDGRPGNEQPNGEQAGGVLPPETPLRAEQPPSPTAARRAEPEQPAAAQSQAEATLTDPADGNAPMAVREVTTEFLPFPYAEGLSAGERVQLIHVRLPGEALTLFGLPSAADPSATVPADVLLGQDGTARAVRFVRFTGSTTGGDGGGSRY